MAELDEFDRKIIAALQENGRLTNMEVAGMVNLSHSSCSRRIARLERDEVITGYRALTNRARLGLTVRAYCGIVRDSKVGWKELAERLARIDGVVSVFAVTGEADIMLEIVAKDMQHYSQAVLRDVLGIEGVSATRSSFILEEVKSLY